MCSGGVETRTDCSWHGYEKGKLCSGGRELNDRLCLALVGRRKTVCVQG